MSTSTRKSARLLGEEPKEDLNLSDRLSFNWRETKRRSEDKNPVSRDVTIPGSEANDPKIPGSVVGQPTLARVAEISSADRSEIYCKDLQIKDEAFAHKSERDPLPAGIASENVFEIVEKTVSAVFGRWTAEMADREAARGRMVRQMLQEELQAQSHVLRQEISRDYAKLDELQELRADSDSLRVTMRSQQRRPSKSRSRSPAGAKSHHPAGPNAGLTDDWSTDTEVDYDFKDFPSHRNLKQSSRAAIRPRLLVRGLDEIEPADPRFSDLVSYKRYRLLNRDSSLGPDVSRHVGKWTRRLYTTMEKHVFDGTKPVACLRFLAAYKRALDSEGIPEGAALKMWPSFLKDDAYDLFTQMTEDGDADLGGFQDWPHAVQFFLQTYAKDQYLEAAAEKLDSIKQERDEDVRAFYRRLMSAARDLAGAFSQQELLTKFMRGVHADIRPLLRRIRHGYKGPNALRELAEEAAAIHDAHSAVTRKQEKKVRILSVDDEDPPRRKYFDTSAAARDARSKRGIDPVSLAEGRQGPAPRVIASTTDSVEYSDIPKTYDESVPESIVLSLSAPPDPYEVVYAVQPHPSTKSGQELMTNRSAFRRYPTFPEPRTRRATSSPLDICFICFIAGYRSPKCPHLDRVKNDPAFQAWALRNFNSLQEWQRMWLSSINRAPPQAAPPQANKPDAEARAPALGAEPCRAHPEN